MPLSPPSLYGQGDEFSPNDEPDVAKVVDCPQSRPSSVGRRIDIQLSGAPYTWNAYQSSSPTKIVGCEELRISSVAIGAEHTVMLTEEGAIHALGHNAHGQLAHPMEKDVSSIPLPIPFSGRVVRTIECGWHHSAAITTDSKLFCWGLASSGQCGTGLQTEHYTTPQHVKFQTDPADNRPKDVLCQGEKQVIQVTCGRTHTMAVTSDGKAYSWGSGNQLGLGDDNLTKNAPSQILAFENHTTINLEAGEFHSLAIVCQKESLSKYNANWQANSEYEVWSWGMNDVGQLGQGNWESTSVPKKIKPLQSIRVVGLAAGSRHSVARTCLGHVYTWGLNDQHQLGRLTKNTSGQAACSNIPENVRFYEDKGIVSIKAAISCTILLGSSGTGDFSTVYFMGPKYSRYLRPDTKNTNAPSANVEASNLGLQKEHDDFLPKQLTNIGHVGFVRCITAGGDTCGLLSHDKGLGAAIVLLLRELASSEVTFVNKLRNNLRDFLVPLASKVRNGNQGVTLDGTEPTLFELVSCYSEVWHQSCTLVTQFTNSSNLGYYYEVLNTLEIVKPDELFIRFITTMSNAVATAVIGPFSVAMKHSQDGEKIKAMFDLPIKRMEQYEILFRRLSSLLLSDASSSMGALSLANAWEKCIAFYKREVESAKRTCSFWLEFPHAWKRFGKAEHRLILHSKSVRLQPSKANFLSGSPWIVLVNHALIVSQVFSDKEYPLSTLWIEDVNNDSSNNLTIRLSWPGSAPIMEFIAASPDDKSTWINALLSAINGCVESINENGIPEVVSPGPRTIYSEYNLSIKELETRSARIRILNHSIYKDAEYHGDVFRGKMTGTGAVLCDDGRIYKGSFVEGFCEGYVEMTSPIGPTDQRLAKGSWKNGKMSGVGIVFYHNNHIYFGNWENGVRDGHGTLVSDGQDRYVGSWKAGERHGYGVWYDGRRGNTHLGLWHGGERHGFGIVVSNGLYYEGVFLSNRFSGRGILISEDDTTYDGEFTSECVLHGKGRLTYPSGDYIEGHFKGEWQNKSGIQITGTFVQASKQPKRNNKLPFQGMNIDFSDSRGEIAAMTSHLRPPRVPMEKRWIPIYEASSKALTNLPEHDVTGLSSIEQRKQILTMFHTPKHPLNQMVIQLYDAYCASYGTSTCHRRLLSDAVVELKTLIDRVEASIQQNMPEFNGCFIDDEGSIEDNATCKSYDSKFLKNQILEDLYELLQNLYWKNFAVEEGIYAKCIAGLNEESDQSLLNLLGVKKEFWLVDIESPIKKTPFQTPFRRQSLRIGDNFEKNRDLETSFELLNPVTTSPTHFGAKIDVRDVADSFLEVFIGSPSRSEMTSTPRHDAASPSSVLNGSISFETGASQTGVPKHTSVSMRAMRDELVDEDNSCPYIVPIRILRSLPRVHTADGKVAVLASVFVEMRKAVSDYTKNDEQLASLDEILPVFLFLLVRARIPFLRSEMQFMFDFIDFDNAPGETQFSLTTLRASFYQLLQEGQ